MEEKRPGQDPEREHPAAGIPDNKGGRLNGAAAGSDDGEDRARIRKADARGQHLREELAADGFGDHKGVEGFPGIRDRE